MRENVLQYDWKVMAEKIIEIYKSRENLTLVAQNAEAFIKENYDADKNITGYIDTFQQLVK